MKYLSSLQPSVKAGDYVLSNAVCSASAYKAGECMQAAASHLWEDKVWWEKIMKSSSIEMCRSQNILLKAAFHPLKAQN